MVWCHTYIMSLSWFFSYLVGPTRDSFASVLLHTTQFLGDNWTFSPEYPTYFLFPSSVKCMSWSEHPVCNSKLASRKVLDFNIFSAWKNCSMPPPSVHRDREQTLEPVKKLGNFLPPEKIFPATSGHCCTLEGYCKNWTVGFLKKREDLFPHPSPRH